MKITNYKYPKNELVIISCFFGDAPKYFSLFLLSCQYNNKIKFIILADFNIHKYVIPENVDFIHFTMDNFNQLASKKLKLNISIKYPYKLCDFKPTYGILFNELISNYRYWGYSDLDVIFGNIKNFITSNKLKLFDVISTKHDYLTGVFSIFKNTSKINNLFKKSKDYIRVFQTDVNFCFDEIGLPPIHKINESEFNFNDKLIKVESLNDIIMKCHLAGKITALFDQMIIEGIPGKITWDKGKLIYNRKFEVLLYHLMDFKGKDITPSNKECFRISKIKIY